MARLDELIARLEATEASCDKKCNECSIYLPYEKTCYHAFKKRVDEWNRKEHERFGKVLRGEI